MLFSSITFLFYFLPVFLFFYFIIPSKYRNILILIFSFLFYFLGEPKYIWVLLSSCVVNYFLSKKIESNNKSKVYLLIGVFYNVGCLLIFKYIDFFISNINNLFSVNIAFTHLTMPIGISFFTFQALGYVIDVYNKKHASAKNIWEFMAYISLFPQLIAGPIVRYSDIKNDLQKRHVNYDKFASGVSRFIVGLAKKVLIANVLGEFDNNLTEETVLSSWLKPIAYTFQIYFDFSGYSDMAIGLGLMMGFTFLENFNYPLVANCVTDFWRRWHISLSSWFKDYIYIPLGGNRVSKLKWIRNLLVVWFLTGFWHVASWNFILWGLYFGILLIFEKLVLLKFISKTKILKYMYTSIIVIISFLIFKNESLYVIFDELKNMFLISSIPLIGVETLYYLKKYLVLLIISVIGSTPMMKYFINKLRKTKLKYIIDIL